MMQWQNSQQRIQIRHLAWVISLLLFLSPIFAQAHWVTPMSSSGATIQQMPCHQAESHLQKENCKHCSGTESSMACDCCDSAVPLSLSVGQCVFTAYQFHTELQISPYAREFPDPPPASLYRPPIQHLI